MRDYRAKSRRLVMAAFILALIELLQHQPLPKKSKSD